MINLNYFGAAGIIGGVLGGAGLLGGITSNMQTGKKAQEEAQKQAAWQRAMSAQQMAENQKRLANMDSFLARLGAGDEGRAAAKQNMEASDLVATKLAGQQANRTAGIAREQSLNQLRQSGLGSPLSRLAASAQSRDAAVNTYKDLYGGMLDNNLSAINQKQQELQNAAGLQTGIAGQALQMGGNMGNAAGQTTQQGLLTQNELLQSGFQGVGKLGSAVAGMM